MKTHVLLFTTLLLLTPGSRRRPRSNCRGQTIPSPSLASLSNGAKERPARLSSGPGRRPT